jgi:Uma2 family endonuclease
MTESFKHGETAEILNFIVTTLADLLKIEFIPAGRTTFKRENNKAGFEGDGSFYFQNADAVRGKDKIDLKIDPPPELVTEVDVTNPSLPKFPIFARLGVSEIWRYDGAEVKFYRLQDNDYVETDESVCVKGVTNEIVTNLLHTYREMKRLEWVKLVRKSVKKIKPRR